MAMTPILPGARPTKKGAGGIYDRCRGRLYGGRCDAPACLGTVSENLSRTRSDQRFQGLAAVSVSTHESEPGQRVERKERRPVSTALRFSSHGFAVIAPVRHPARWH